MILRHLDDSRDRGTASSSDFEISPFERAVKIIHHRAASAQQELAQRCASLSLMRMLLGSTK